MKCNSLSSSRIKCYDMCEFKYMLDYHLALEQKKKWASENGTFCHEIYENLADELKTGKGNPQTYETWFRQTVEAYRHTRTITNRFGKEEEIPPLWTLSEKALKREKHCDDCKYYGDGNCFVVGKKIDSFQGCPYDEFETSLWLIERVLEDKGSLDLRKRRKIIDTERAFRCKIDDGTGGEITINGVIDLICEVDKETIEIEDYKTGNFTQNPLESRRDMQFLIYHMAAREQYPQYKWIFVTVHWLKRRSGRSPTFCFSDKDVQETKRKLIVDYHNIRNNEFPLRRCDRSNGKVEFDYVCKYMCDPDTCQKEWEKMIEKGGIEEDA